jgi:hypothetical protein
MRFEGRDLTPHARPVEASELVEGTTYFAVQFLDDQMLVPKLEPLVYIGADLIPGDERLIYFQDAESHRHGVRLHSDSESDIVPVFYGLQPIQLNHIYEFEDALDVLLHCSLRRRGPAA